MAWNLLAQLRQFLDGNPSVRMVADDIELTCELVLLVRMMFADGELKDEEFDNFERLCGAAFGIPPEDVPEVLKYLREFGYEITAAKAAEMFTEMPGERKRALLLHMLSIAKADNELDAQEAELIRRTAKTLGMNVSDIRTVQEG